MGAKHDNIIYVKEIEMEEKKHPKEGMHEGATTCPVGSMDCPIS